MGRTRKVVDPFERVAKAADVAAEQVLAEDALLRRFGIMPAAGRSS